MKILCKGSKWYQILLFQVCIIALFIGFSSTVFSLPRQISPPGEKMVLVDPREHAWGAYDASGRLLRSGLASAGADWCADVGRECHTMVGSFRVRSLGSGSCTSPSFPLPKGGAPMPYCMYFNEYQALHGSYQLAHANISHGCVRMRVADARWLRYNFVQVGTLVVVQSY
jgi:lipoprotein-anchoring transpeptidase ErfK/SrfK